MNRLLKLPTQHEADPLTDGKVTAGGSPAAGLSRLRDASRPRLFTKGGFHGPALFIRSSARCSRRPAVGRPPSNRPILALGHRREVRHLAELDDRMLKDIGLLRSDVDGALAEPLYAESLPGAGSSRGAAGSGSGPCEPRRERPGSGLCPGGALGMLSAIGPHLRPTPGSRRQKRSAAVRAPARRAVEDRLQGREMLLLHLASRFHHLAPGLEAPPRSRP